MNHCIGDRGYCSNVARLAPFQAGAGPCVAAMELGCRFIGIGFYRAAELRIADHAAGPTPRGTMSGGLTLLDIV